MFSFVQLDIIKTSPRKWSVDILKQFLQLTRHHMGKLQTLQKMFGLKELDSKDFLCFDILVTQMWPEVPKVVTFSLVWDMVHQS